MILELMLSGTSDLQSLTVMKKSRLKHVKVLKIFVVLKQETIDSRRHVLLLYMYNSLEEKKSFNE